MRFWRIILLITAIGLLSACSSNDSEQPERDEETPTSTKAVFSVAEPVINDLPEQTVFAGEGCLEIQVTMPEGYKLNDLAPFTVSLAADADSVLIPEEWQEYQEVEPTLPLMIPVEYLPGSVLLDIGLTIYWCEAVQQTLCFVDTRDLQLPITVRNTDAASSQTASIAVNLTPPVSP